MERNGLHPVVLRCPPSHTLKHSFLHDMVCLQPSEVVLKGVMKGVKEMEEKVVMFLGRCRVMNTDTIHWAWVVGIYRSSPLLRKSDVHLMNSKVACCQELEKNRFIFKVRYSDFFIFDRIN